MKKCSLILIYHELLINSDNIFCLFFKLSKSKDFFLIQQSKKVIFDLILFGVFNNLEYPTFHFQTILPLKQNSSYLGKLQKKVLDHSGQLTFSLRPKKSS